MTAGVGTGSAPLLTVVVPTFNSAGTLARALQSLAAQTCRDFEVVLSDGASTDATLAVATAFMPQLPALRIDSRRDAGVYDAINRGFALARGDWVLVLGSDDALHASDTLAAVAPTLRTSAAEVVHGDVRVMGPNAMGVPEGGRYAGPMPLERLVMANLCQQAAFYRRSLFTVLGGFNLRYRVWADWDFNLRAAFRQPLQWVDVTVCDYATTGMSSAGGDAVFGRELPEMLRAELARRPHDRTLWPAQRRLLRHARALRRQGRRAEAWRLRATFAMLLLKRAWSVARSS